MSVQPQYVHIDKPAGQPARLVRLPRIRVAQIAMDYLAHGWSVDEICRQHPHLLPAEAHAAMAYYFDHEAEIEQEIQGELQELNELRRLGPQSALAARLPARGKL